MGDLSSALSDSLSGLGGIFSGVGNAFSGVLSGANSGALTSNLINALTGGGATTASPTATAQTTQAISNAIDPTGSVAASEAINPPNAAAVAQRTGDVGGTQSSGAPTPAQSDASAPADTTADQDRTANADAIRKLVAALRGQSVDPYQAGATRGPGMSQGTGGVGSQGRGSDAPYGEGASSQGEYGRPPLNIGPGKGQPFLPQWQGGEGEPAVDIPAIPGISAPNRAQAAGQEAVGNAIRAQQVGEGAVEAATAPEAAPESLSQWLERSTNPDLVRLRNLPPGTQADLDWLMNRQEGAPPEIGPGSPAAAAGIPGWVRALATDSPAGLALRTAQAVMSPTPAETGEMPRQTLGRKPSGPVQQPTPTPTPLPHDDVGKTPTKDEYEKWLKDQGDPPSTAKKKADKSTPAERKKAVSPTDKPPDYWVDDQGRKHEILPTKKPGERPYHMDEIPPGQSRMMRDVHGMQGVPQMLGQLAQLALPLLMMGMGGGFGGGRHRGGDFRGFPFGHGGHGRFGGGPFHPGMHPGGHGSGMWPYHHEGMGWRGFGYHPGGGWRPWGGPGAAFARHHDAEMARRNAMMSDGGGDPGLQIIQALLGGGQQQQGQQTQQGQQPGRFGDSGGEPVQQGPWSDNPFLSTLVGAESGGRNITQQIRDRNSDAGTPGQGFYQIIDPTWRRYAAQVPGASAYSSAREAPANIQTAVAQTIPINQFGHNTIAALRQKFGNFDMNMTVGQLADKFGGMNAAGGMMAGLPTGKTPTGDLKVAAQ